MPLRLPPPGTNGDIRLIRTSLPLLREDPQDCPRGNALRARALLTQVPQRPRGKPIEDFALGPVMSVLDAIEHEGEDVDSALARLLTDQKYHAGHVHWAESAVRSYLLARTAREAQRRMLGRRPTLPVRAQWTAITQSEVPDARGATRYERTAWGRRYASADGSERELWLLSVNSINRNRSPAEIAEAAAVAATGIPSQPAFRDIFRPVPGCTVRPQRVRIVGIGCGSGEHDVLADWEVDEVERQFAKHAKPVLRRVVEDDRLNPGSSCTRCEGLVSCEQPPRTPGVLGVPGPRRPRVRRSVSASDLRVHARCPAQFHLTRVLHLKSGNPESESIRRGRAVDEWLNLRHKHGCCRTAPLPDALPGLSSAELPAALALLAEHQRACPLDGLPPDEVIRVQPRLTAYDPELDVVLIADPDLLYTRSGGWIWHETKTAAKPPWEGRALMETYPQLAFAVLMMSAGVLGGDPRRSLIELEVLYPDAEGTGRSRCEEIDPGDPDTLAEARRIIAGLAGPWAVDETYAPTPGDHCDGCDVLRHCAAGQAHLEAR
ncbi:MULTISPECIES: PD-(D/E)XK nuclease family protein [Streptomyces]|uniref:PD-(D/E)XK endonuclease-like domain-containing protein n=1 Tax=Streptomyces thermogriseus TaxID=75292 RepID=A0ABP4DLA1_9ACTN|nr:MULTISPECIES: PD-(D/E)XK nuclease family protein [Streptomyces]MDN5383010.1 PD-(D/E)XK nuclease family protein [Streptomyces sp. LB8]